MHKDYIIDLYEKLGYKIYKVEQGDRDAYGYRTERKNNIGMQGFDVQGQI